MITKPKRKFRFNVGVILTLALASFLTWVVIDEGANSGADWWLVVLCALVVALLCINIALRLSR